MTDGWCNRAAEVRGEYDDLLTDLINSGVIADAKMAYFDVRPSSHAPTVELRIADDHAAAPPRARDGRVAGGLRPSR